MRIVIVIAVFLLLLAPQAAPAADETYTFSGRGTAHGVGLDMAGVEARAAQGRGYEEILKTYYSGVSFAGGHEGDELRVGILSGGELQFTADSGYMVYANNSGPGTHVARDVITHVTFENGQYVTRVDGIGTWRLPGFTRLQADGGGRLKVLNNGRRYRGHLEARRSSTDLLWAIEVTNIEDYIKGIAEEPNTWPREAQRTLAVAARTYALNKKFYSTRWDSENFDIDATLGSQYYLGYDAERPNLVQAAADTRCKVIVYDNKIIVAAYHGNSGGHTESLVNVWGGSPGDYPYLKAVASPWTPVYRWGPKTFTKSQLQDIFNSRSESYIGNLDSIDLSNRTPSGRLYKVRITGSAGTKEVWGYSQFANWLGLPSALLDGAGIPADNWDNFILLVNPNDRMATARITFIFPDGRRKLITRRVGANARRTITVDRLVKAGGVAARVSSDLPIVAERSVYFANGGSGGGHNSIGARSASRVWYFAESRTGKNFDTYLMIMNSRSTPTRVTAIFMRGNGRRIKKRVRVGAFSRKAILVDGVGGLASVSAPVKVISRKPVVVERVIYSHKQDMIGGYGGIGANRLSKTWYFSEGFTGSGFKNRLIIFNPSGVATTARVTLSKADGAEISREFVVGARSRRPILLNNMASGVEFGIKVAATSGVMAERVVYFNSGGKTGAHSTIGSPNTSKTWYFAEGDTGSGFDEFLTVFNPGNSQANLTVRYLAAGGAPAITRLHAVAAHSRKTITVGSLDQVGAGRVVGAQISSDQPIVAERVMYFSYSGNRGRSTWTGGHVTIGATAPSKRWFFAEGNTQR